MPEAFPAEWLALREAWDAAARSPALAARLNDALPARPRLIDLGAGTGSLFRWLAPRLGRAQAWTLYDADQSLLTGAFEAIADWAAAHGWTVTWPGRTLLVHTPHGAWRVEGRIADLADGPDALPEEGYDAVLCSALCDLVSADWVAAMAESLRVPFYAVLNVDGRESFLPRHPADPLVRRAFARDQRRDKGFGPALGGAAPAAIRREFAAQGFTVLSATSPWVIPGAARLMTRMLVEGHAGAALAADRRHAGAIMRWAEARMAQARHGRLALRIGHRDLLALPGE
ncbi:class I SAM-dependent methyltransferase [Roseomonas sp. NAR14]|uniref:Class I SAM-dependent methyltransferase n=1 Tax=Roseomonas acroporae TaxID=2937791 RepID=A0A9X2BSJ2_9PROT|nr:class I SAM-dependent methyltransferase [Roseomonas acroporae]MCK8783177.1 class I SAM-dependent methyltransferase [Roseomonas acroporae]